MRRPPVGAGPAVRDDRQPRGGRGRGGRGLPAGLGPVERRCGSARAPKHGYARWPTARGQQLAEGGEPAPRPPPRGRGSGRQRSRTPTTSRWWRRSADPGRAAARHRAAPPGRAERRRDRHRGRCTVRNGRGAGWPVDAALWPFVMESESTPWGRTVVAEQNLSAGLTALAEHAERTGRLTVAADIRERGDRRRRRRYTGSAGLVLVVAATFSAGIALSQTRFANERPAVPQMPAASQPGGKSPLPAVPPESPAPAKPSPAPPSPAVSPPAVSTAPVAVPPGGPTSPVKAPPPEYPYTADPAVPATTAWTR